MVRTVGEIYTETRSRIVIKNGVIAEFWTGKGMRQGCPLIPTLFNVVFADLERKMSRCHVAGLKIGRGKVWTITYVDDGALVAGSQEGLQEIVEWFERYVEKKGLRISTEKSKVMRFWRGARRWRKMEIRWRREKVEDEKEFLYLAYKMGRNNGEVIHVEYLAKKAEAISGMVWGLGEILLGENLYLYLYSFTRRKIIT